MVIFHNTDGKSQGFERAGDRDGDASIVVTGYRGDKADKKGIKAPIPWPQPNPIRDEIEF